MAQLNSEPCCPFRTAQSLISGKYKQQIVWELMKHNLRFSELLHIFSGITSKVLSQQLRMLESDGLITRTVYPDTPPKVEYALTDLGISVRPILIAMLEWGQLYLAENKKISACADCHRQ